jgi:hypothetical protein
MKKQLSIIFIAIIVFGCKKEQDRVSQIVKVSAPTISFTGSKFYSINVGESVPAIVATAYDSVLNESYTVEYDPAVIDATTPGLYVVPMTAKNKYGYIGSDVVFVAVTSIPDSIDLSGLYKRTTGEPVNITKVERGLYETDDVGGAATLEITAYFVQINDTLLDVPPQPTPAGSLHCVTEKVTGSGAPGTTISWAVRNAFFGTQLRTFVKQ